jgi:hypothetical protein
VQHQLADACSSGCINATLAQLPSLLLQAGGTGGAAGFLSASAAATLATAAGRFACLAPSAAAGPGACIASISSALAAANMTSQIRSVHAADLIPLALAAGARLPLHCHIQTQRPPLVAPSAGRWMAACSSPATWASSSCAQGSGRRAAAPWPGCAWLQPRPGSCAGASCRTSCCCCPAAAGWANQRRPAGQALQQSCCRSCSSGRTARQPMLRVARLPGGTTGAAPLAARCSAAGPGALRRLQTSGAAISATRRQQVRPAAGLLDAVVQHACQDNLVMVMPWLTRRPRHPAGPPPQMRSWAWGATAGGRAAAAAAQQQQGALTRTSRRRIAASRWAPRSSSPARQVGGANEGPRRRPALGQLRVQRSSTACSLEAHPRQLPKGPRQAAT